MRLVSRAAIALLGASLMVSTGSIAATAAAAGLDPVTLTAAAQSFAQSFTEEWAGQWETCGAQSLVGCHMDNIKGSSYRGNVLASQGWSRGGDLLARGFQTEEEAVRGWLNSAGHRAWIMDEYGEIDAIGIGLTKRSTASNGYTYDQNFWTLWVVGGAKTSPSPDLTPVAGTETGGSKTPNVGTAPSAPADTDTPNTSTTPDTSTTPNTSTTPSTPGSTGNSSSTTSSSTTVARLSGATRYETNLALNKKTMEKNKAIFVATGANFPNALAVGPAVAVTGGSLFLTSATQADPDALALIKERGASNVYVIGGTGAVSDSVAKAYARAAGTSYTRISGADRYDTALKVFTTFFRSAPTALIATGSDFPDALSAASAGGSLGAPVLLVAGSNSTGLTAAQSKALRNAGTKNVAIVGGTGVVNTKLEKALKSSGYAVERLSGADRYSTNSAVNNFVSEEGGSAASSIWVATGSDFPDALSAAAPSGEGEGRLVLSNGQCLPKAGSSALKSRTELSVYLVGGTGVLGTPLEQLKTC